MMTVYQNLAATKSIAPIKQTIA